MGPDCGTARPKLAWVSRALMGGSPTTHTPEGTGGGFPTAQMTLASFTCPHFLTGWPFPGLSPSPGLREAKGPLSITVATAGSDLS